MATSTYSLAIPGNSTITVSKDELRSLLRFIEVKLHRSLAYRQASANLQNLLGESSEQAQTLLKIVSREAMGLVIQQLALYSQTIQDSHTHVETNDESANKSHENQDLNECLTSVSQSSQVESENKTVASSQLLVPDNLSQENSQPKNSLNFWQRNKKPSPLEVQKLASQKHLECLHKIGQQLKQARESQGLSLSQLGVYTHIPMYHMESIEKGYAASLPDDVFVRGFIRIMGNTLGLDGDSLAASLPTAEKAPLTLPPSYQPQKTPSGLGKKLSLELSPAHLYVGYTALVAGAVGGLSFMSPQTTENKTFSDRILPSTQSVADSFRHREANAKPGIKSEHGGVNVGIDIAPPEAL